MTVPKTGIANGQSDTVTVQVTSQARHDVIETIQVQTTTPTFYYSLQSSTQDMAVDLGNSYNFRIQINNHGLNDDTYRISLDGGNWDYVIRNDLDNANINAISVDGQKTGVFVVKVSVPLTGVTRGEAETITINTVSQGNAEASKNIQITTSTPIYSFDLTQATDNAFVYPGQTFFYQMKIGNTGSYTDTYNLSLEPGSWAYAIRDKSDIANITELSVGGGVTDTFLIKTKVPRTIGENDACTITVVSQGNTTSKETISVISTISTFAFNMTANAYTSIVLPGESVNYSIQINNTSTAADTFNLSLSGGNFNYWIRNATDTANITRMLVYGGQTGTFLVKVKALNSDQIANGTHDSVSINAVSQGNKTLSDAIQLTSTTPTYAFSLQNSSGNAVAFADDIKDYIVTIQNTGSYIDTYNLSLSGGNWHRMIRNADDNAMIDSITLDKQSTGSFIIRQFVPSSAELANGETESITISAISQGRSQISHAVLITTTIPTFSFALTNVTNHATVHPGQYVLYPIEIKNDGATMDSYNLSISEDVWPCVFRNASDTATISSISLDAGYTALFWLKVSVPITGVSSGQSDTATVMVTSKGSATVNRSAQMTTATPVFGFNMANLSNNLQIYPGETAHYTFCITNTSLTDDTFLLNVSGSQFQSEISNAEDTANIDAISVNHGSTDTFIVKVIVPKAGVANGVSDTITVSAISLGNKSLVTQIQATTTIPSFSFTVQALTNNVLGSIGESYYFPIEVINTGATLDTYNLSLSSSTWEHAIRNESDTATIDTLSVRSGYTALLFVKVNVPSTGVSNNQQDSVLLEITSQGNQTVQSASVQLTTTTHLVAFHMQAITDNSVVYPGKSYGYAIQLSNNGSFNDTYDLSTTSGNFSYTIRDQFNGAKITEISVDAGSTETFYVNVDVPYTNLSNGDDDTVVIQCVSQNNSGMSQSISLTTTTPTFNFVLSKTSPDATIYPGQSFNYSVSLTNVCAWSDTFDLTISGGAWNYQIRDVSDTKNIGSLSVGPGLSKTFLVKVSVPYTGVANGASESIEISAVSQGHYQVSQTDQITTTTPTISFTVQNLTGNSEIQTGQKFYYDYQVQNTGTAMDTYDLFVSGGNWNYTIRNAGDFGTINHITANAGESVRFFVCVTAPQGTSNGATDSIEVTTISHGNPSVQNIISTTSTTPVVSQSVMFAMPDGSQETDVETSQQYMMGTKIETVDAENQEPPVIYGTRTTNTLFATSGNPISGSGYALTFDGTDDYVQLQQNYTWPTTHSIMGWIYLENYNFVASILSAGNVSGAANAAVAEFRIYQDKLDYLEGDGITGGTVTSNTIFVQNQWYHVAVVKNASTVTLYVNGEIDNTGTVAANFLSNVDVAIGEFLLNGAPQANYYFKGKMDEISFWSKALSQNEIQTNMNQPLIGNESGLISYYSFDQENGSILHDISGNGNDGTLINMDNSDWVVSDAKIHAHNGPAGIGGTNGLSDLNLWLHTENLQSLNSGDPVASWVDASGNNVLVEQSTTANQPQYLSNQLNGHGTISFSGYPNNSPSSDYDYFNLGTQNFSPGTDLSIFLITKVDTTGDCFFLGHNNGWDKYRFGSASFQSNRHTASDYNTDYSKPDEFTIINLNVNSSQAIVYWNDVQKGSAYSMSSANFDQTNDFWIGGAEAGGNYSLDGSISEIIIYGATLNQAQRTILNNYLSAKYAISISSDKYAGDDPAKGNYDNDVAGIGKESDGSQFSAQSAGFLLRNSNFLTDNGDYLVVGHADSTSASFTNTQNDLPTGVTNRLTRIWYMDRTDGGASANGNIIIGFDYSEAGLSENPSEPEKYTLLYRSGTSGTFSEVSSITANTRGDCLYFEIDSSTISDGYYSLGWKPHPGSGYALSFDGTNDNVNLGTNIGNHFSGGSAITIEYWFKGSVFQSPVRFQDSPDTTNFIVAGWNLSQSNPLYIINTDGAADGISCGDHNYITDGRWHHLAMTWQRNTTLGFKSYLDGVLVEQRDSADVGLPPFTNERAFLGAHGNTGEFIKGQLDEVRIWDVVRSQSEIQQNMCQKLAGNESGLFAYYRFDHIDGSTLSDLTGNGNNGTLLNMDNNDWVVSSAPIGDTSISTYINTGQGYALTLDGVNEYVQVPFDAPETNYTLELWFKTNVQTTGIASFRHPTLGGACDRWLYLTNGNIYHFIYDSETINSTGQNFADNQWHHVAVVVESGVGQKIYVDGVLHATGTKHTSDFNWDSSFDIGFSYNGTANSYFTGSIDEVRLWNEAKTQANIQKLMYSSLTGSELNLLLYYNFNQQSGTVIRDMSTNSYTGQGVNIENTDWVVSTLSLTDKASFSPPFGKGGLKLDGVDEYIAVPMNHPETNYTYEVWFKTPLQTTGISIVRESNLTGGNDRNLYLSSGNICHRIFEDETICTTGQNYGDNDWHHVAVVVDSTSGQKVYVDGTLMASGTKASSDFNWDGCLDIGVESNVLSSTQPYFKGNLYEVRLWNEVRTQAEIQENMHTLLAGTETNLSAYFRFDEEYTTTITDRTGNGYNGQLQNIESDDWTQFSISSASLSNTSGDQLTATCESSFGVQLYHVDDSPSNLQSLSGVYDYWGVFPIGNSRSYSVLYNNSGNYDQLFGRYNNSDSSWSNINANNNTVTNTLSQTNLSTFYGITISELVKLPLPSFDEISAQASAAGTYNFTVTATENGTLTLTVISSDQGIIPDSGLILSASSSNTHDFNATANIAENLTLTINPNADQHGRVTVSIIALDSGNLTSSTDFSVIVSPPGSGNALRFDGTDEYVRLQENYTWPTTFSIMGWIYLEDYNFVASILSAGNVSGAANTAVAVFDIYEDKLRYLQNDGISNLAVSSNTTIFQNRWCHVAVVKDASAITLYIDGEIDNTGTLANNLQYPVDVAIGEFILNGALQADFYYKGKIDELSFWSTPLSTNDIRDNMCKRLTGSETGLLYYYRFDHTSGTTLTDLSGNNNHGTLINMENSDGVTSGAALGDISSYDYTGTVASDYIVSLSHSNGDQMTATGGSGTYTGIHLYLVNESPNLTSLPSEFWASLYTDHYWGVFPVGTDTTYAIDYNYSGVSYVSDETKASLAGRYDNASTSWNPVNPQIDTESNILSQTSISTLRKSY